MRDRKARTAALTIGIPTDRARVRRACVRACDGPACCVLGPAGSRQARMRTRRPSRARHAFAPASEACMRGPPAYRTNISEVTPGGLKMILYGTR
jgi:hypothetical protein